MRSQLFLKADRLSTSVSGSFWFASSNLCRLIITRFLAIPTCSCTETESVMSETMMVCSLPVRTPVQ